MSSIGDLCMGCMELRTSGPVCSACAWREGSGLLHGQQLPPRTVLAGKYLLGKALGQGGFGITYLAWDLNLNRKLAVKEYFPRELGARAGDSSVVPVSTRTRSDYEYGLGKFLEEGRTLARLDHPGIVDVFDYFQENGTAYLVMKYLEGLTLAEELKEKDRLPFEKGLRILTPVMDALREVHQTGLLHRDISPQNIYLCSSGQVKLFDFGAARVASAEQSQSLSVILKPGYAPFEQYQSKGRQGPWTDVYGLAATLYRAITGQAPPEAPERREKDTIKRPSSLGVAIPAAGESALMKGLAVKVEDRFQDMLSFEKAIGLPKVEDRFQDMLSFEKATGSLLPKKKQKWKLVLVLALLALVLMVWLLWPTAPRVEIGSLDFFNRNDPSAYTTDFQPFATIGFKASLSRPAPEDITLGVQLHPPEGTSDPPRQSVGIRKGQATVLGVLSSGRLPVGNYTVEFFLNKEKQKGPARKFTVTAPQIPANRRTHPSRTLVEKGPYTPPPVISHSLPPPPVSPIQPVLAQLLPGTWQIQMVNSMTGMVSQLKLQLFPNGMFRGQLTTPMGVSSVDGQWLITPMNQFVLQARGSNIPALIQFSQIQPNELMGVADDGEQSTWHRIQ